MGLDIYFRAKGIGHDEARRVKERIAEVTGIPIDPWEPDDDILAWWGSRSHPLNSLIEEGTMAAQADGWYTMSKTETKNFFNAIAQTCVWVQSLTVYPDNWREEDIACAEELCSLMPVYKTVPPGFKGVTPYEADEIQIVIHEGQVFNTIASEIDLDEHPLEVLYSY